MMQILKEVTQWDCDYKVANHTYLIDSNTVFAYAKNGSDNVIKLKTPLKIDKRYRKFIQVNHYGLSRLIPNNKKDNTRAFKVQSGEKTYIVEYINNRKFNCTCTGFTFRGKCKHIDAVKEKL